jgi:hypothetical protein
VQQAAGGEQMLLTNQQSVKFPDWNGPARAGEFKDGIPHEKS